MIGHNAILALRQQRRMPAAVHVCVLDHVPTYRPWNNPENALENGGFPQIDILPTDEPETLDLRMLRGVTVHLSGYDHHRVMTVLDRMTEFEPARILACRLTTPRNIIDWTPEHGLVEHETEAA